VKNNGDDRSIKEIDPRCEIICRELRTLDKQSLELVFEDIRNLLDYLNPKPEGLRLIAENGRSLICIVCGGVMEKHDVGKGRIYLCQQNRCNISELEQALILIRALEREQV